MQDARGEAKTELRTLRTGRKCFTNLPSLSYFLPKVMGEYTRKYW